MQNTVTALAEVGPWIPADAAALCPGAAGSAE